MPSQASGINSSDNMTKYSHLLQPIRDLTKNWDIDVATQLEEYLCEIERIEISFDGGITTMNFAEAALLIQGSACVYSKKVEYLHTLVYQTLDLISSKKRLQQASSVDNQGKDKDVSFENQEEELLPLDDIEAAKNIDLKEDENITCEVIPRTPMALIKLGDKDKEDLLLSRTGEVLGSRQDFKMNTCSVHASGALLLDPSHVSLLDDSFKRLPTSTPQISSVLGIQPDAGCESKALDHDLQQAAQVPGGALIDYDDDIADPVMGPDDTDEGIEACGMQQAPPLQEFDSEEVKDKCRMELRQHTRQPQQLLAQQQKFRDPWEVLDPHQPSPKSQLKPFKKGRPFKIPFSLRTPTTAKRKKRKRSDEESDTEKPKIQLMPLAEFMSQAFYSHASKYPKNPLHAPKFQEFEYLFWVEFRKRQSFLKRERKQLLQQFTPEQFQEINLIPGDKEDCDNDSPADDANDEADDGDDFGGYDDDFPATSPIEPMALEEPVDEPIVSSYEDLVRHHVQGFLSSAEQYAQETDLSRRVRDWEEKIKPKLQVEETHRPFNIHLYGEEVLESFKESPQNMFKDIVKGKEPFEICRHFLATLQLANNYNVEIGFRGAGDSTVNAMNLRLLHKTPAHKAIATYRAPSALT